MPVLLIIFGAILVLFGGGCTLIILSILSVSNNLWQDLKDSAFIFAMLMLPLFAGLLMIRAGLRMKRKRRALEDQSTEGKQS